VAQRVLKDVGGAGNIVAAAHCATRLRLVLKNQDKVDQAAIDNDEDLKGSFLNAGQFQIIVGPGDVNEVHKHLIAAGAPEASKDDLKEIASKQGNIVSRFIKTIADIFVPLIPVLVGGGMLMAINSVLTSKGIFGPESFIAMHPEWADFADIINLLSAAPFAFLPVLVGFSATKVFGGNPYLGLTMGAAMVSPALMNGYSVAASLAGAEGTDPMKYWNLFGLQVQQAGYQGTVLPIMLVAFILANIEKFFHKVLKGTIDFIFTPTLTILITGFLTFILVGPPMFQLGTWLGEGVNWLYTVAGPLGGLVCILVTGNIRNLIPYTDFGLSKVIGVAILLIGTGTIAGIIKASALQKDMTTLLSAMNMPAFILAPLSGILMAAATASTTAGSTVASQTFSGTLLAAGVPALSAAAMIHAGATVLDSLPHGSFFHATGGSVYMEIKNRMKLIPFEALIGLTSTIVAVILYLVTA